MVICVQFYELKLFLTATRSIRCSISLNLLPNVRSNKSTFMNFVIFQTNVEKEKKLTKCQCQNIHSNKFPRWKTFKSSSITDDFWRKHFVVSFRRQRHWHASLSFDSQISWAYVCDGLSMRQHFSPHYSKHFRADFIALIFCFPSCLSH